MVWGVENATHTIAGTSFKPRSQKIGNEDLEPWLSRQLRPGLHFTIHEFTVESKKVVLFKIQPCGHTPVRWKDHAYIRVGSHKKKLRDYPEKERALWTRISQTTFEKELAAQALTGEEVLARLDYPSYFELLGQPVASTRPAILKRLQKESMIQAAGGDLKSGDDQCITPEAPEYRRKELRCCFKSDLGHDRGTAGEAKGLGEHFEEAR